MAIGDLTFDDLPTVEKKKRTVRDLSFDDLPETLGFAQSMLIGAGRTADNFVQGIKQEALNLGTLLPKEYGGAASRKALDEQAAKRKADDVEYEKLRRAQPWATGLGEVAPLVASPLLGRGVAGVAASMALPGLIEYGTPGEKLLRGGVGAAGGAVGAALGNLVAKVLQPFAAAPGATQAEARAAADRLAVRLRPDEIVQSRPLSWATSSLRDLPISGGMAQAEEAARRGAINAAANRAIGQTGNEVTEGTLATARTNIGQTFDALLQGRQIPLDTTFRSEVRAVTNSKVMKGLRDESVDAIVAPFQNMPAGNIKVSGEWFQQNKTALDQAIRGAYTAGENGKAMALEQFERALERAAARSMTADERAAYLAAQKQWANLRLLETGKVVEGGNVMPGRLDSALGTRYKHAYKEGKLSGELPDIAKLGQVYKPLPQSGTTPRAIYSGAAGGLAMFEPVTAASMFVAPALAQKFLQSNAGRKYLTQGLFDVTPEMEKWLIRGGGGMFGLPATVGAGP